MTKTFADEQIELLFPENWELSDHSTANIKQISIQSEKTAVWDFYAFEDRFGAEDVLREFVASLVEQYEEFESQPIEIEFGGSDLPGLEAHFYCGDLLAMSHIFALQSGNAVWIVNYQAENREFDSSLPVFQAITTGLLRNIAA